MQMSLIFVYFLQFTQKRKPLNVVDESDVIQLTFTLNMTTVQFVKNVSHCQQQQGHIHPDHRTQQETSLCDIGSKGQTVTSEYVTSLPMTSGVETLSPNIKNW